MDEQTLERLAHLQAELALLVKREETLTLLATSPYSPNRDEAQENLRIVWQRLAAVHAEIDTLTFPSASL